MGALQCSKKVEQLRFPLLWRPKMRTEVGPGHLCLLAGSEVFHCQDTGGGLILTEYHDLARQLVRDLKRLLQPEAAVAQLDAQSCGSQFARQRQRLRVLRIAYWRNIGVGADSLCFNLRLQGQFQAVFADGEADARCTGATDRLRETVVAAATQ